MLARGRPRRARSRRPPPTCSRPAPPSRWRPAADRRLAARAWPADDPLPPVAPPASTPSGPGRPGPKSGPVGRVRTVASPGPGRIRPGPEPADEALHEVRIRAKRLRYACEAVAEVVGPPAVQLARAAADLQGVLGDFHDAIVAEDWLRSASASATPAQSLAAGQLIARQRDDAARGPGRVARLVEAAVSARSSGPG